MNKYLLLLLLNVPFVFFGLLKAYVSYGKKTLTLSGLIMRFIFWGIILTGLIFGESIYNYLIVNGLTDSTPLSVPDVLQITGIIVCLSLILRLYTKYETLEHQLVQLHQEMSIELSPKSTKDRKATKVAKKH